MIKLLGIIVVVAACCSVASSNTERSCIGNCPVTDTPRHIVLLASTHCKQYCKCERGQPNVMRCRNNWYFSINEGTCVPQEESNCKNYWQDHTRPGVFT